jgi:putative ferrous iron transport protein C
VILAELRDYMKQRRQATLADLAAHFQVDPDAVRGMMDVWIGKGKVRRLPATASCGSSCTKCDPAGTEIYLWTGEIECDVPLPAHCGQR